MLLSRELSTNKRLIMNTYSSLLYQIFAIICGFIIPRFIIHIYGSAVNGLIMSITQFLQFVSFLEFGVGSVVEANLYKPLAEKDNKEISLIMSSANHYFISITKIMICYVVGLCVFYPILTKDNFDGVYTIVLIVVMSLSTISQYYLGISDRILLAAAQQSYINYNIQTVTLCINTIVSAVLIYAGLSIHIVKFLVSVIYVFRPILLRIYVNKNYKIDRKIIYSHDPISQKKNGIAQHVSTVVLENTDVVLLTVFSTLENVSVYSVYQMIVYGVKTVSLSLTAGIKSLLGNLLVQNKKSELEICFGWFEWSLHTLITIVFTCTAILAVPFVKIYTKGMNDASYNQPLFAVLLTLAYALYCLRIPYSTMILAGGHFKQTQCKYIISTLINICFSIFLVQNYDLIGVALGTLASMIYQTFWMIKYTMNQFISRSIIKTYKQYCVDVNIGLAIALVSKIFSFNADNYFEWISIASITVMYSIMISFVINCLFYPKYLIELKTKIEKLLVGENKSI